MRLVLLFLLAGCAVGKPPAATAADAERINVPLAQLETGRTLLIQKCGGCHKPPHPNEHTSSEWPTALAEMSGRAKLDDAELRSIQSYLLALCERPQTAQR